jgi:hypothetical protein
MIASIDELIIEITDKRAAETTTTRRRSRWTKKEESLFEQVFITIYQLVARFGSDFKLLGSFLPKKTDKQLRKRYRYVMRYGRHRLDKLERQLLSSRRKEFFDQNYLHDTESDSSEASCSSPDLYHQSLL